MGEWYWGGCVDGENGKQGMRDTYDDGQVSVPAIRGEKEDALPEMARLEAVPVLRLLSLARPPHVVSPGWTIAPTLPRFRRIRTTAFTMCVPVVSSVWPCP